MKTFNVTITETLQLEIPVEANSRTEAEHQAERRWRDSEFILDADHFKGVTFKADMPQRGRGFDR
ncbi:MAG: hypothetical protein A2Y17_13320 [Clostridiales bacterium GWF2_38_85]|nr:MAG: hypothetical protein A2Y17_13320 [Clostridiales bacterium GWF2_38_85]